MDTYIQAHLVQNTYLFLLLLLKLSKQLSIFIPVRNMATRVKKYRSSCFALNELLSGVEHPPSYLKYSTDVVFIIWECLDG